MDLLSQGAPLPLSSTHLWADVREMLQSTRMSARDGSRVTFDCERNLLQFGSILLVELD